MTDRQRFVPDGLPQGERQKTVAALNQAGVPLDPGTSATTRGARARPTARTTGRAAGPPGPLDFLTRSTPGDFPFLTEPDATAVAPPSTEPESLTQALAASSQSSFGVAVLSRLNQRR